MIKLELTPSKKAYIEQLHWSSIVNDYKIRTKLDKLIVFYKTKPEAKILRYILDNFREIILGSPKQLDKHRHYIDSQIKTQVIIKDRPAFLTKIQDKVFTYSTEFANIERARDYDAYKLATLLEVPVCCYCNRQYTFTIIDGEQRTRFQFDHFFDKADHPYLGLSLYNLIPSCPSCNTALKKRNKFSLAENIHPYADNGDELFEFCITGDPYAFFMKEPLKKLSVSIRKKKC